MNIGILHDEDPFMSNFFPTALMASLSAHFDLSKSRLETLVGLVMGIIHGRTVNLSHIASLFFGAACHASKYRRLQRFFQYVRLDQACLAPLVVQMLHLSRPTCLVLDRTNWQVGGRVINILVLAIVTRRFRIPVLWTFLDHPGNSDTDQRISLMKRYLALFGTANITLLLADREFIGSDWMSFLIRAKVPFAIRAREDLHLMLADQSLCSLKTLLRTKRGHYTIHTSAAFLPKTGLPIQIGAKRLNNGEWLIILTNAPCAKTAVQAYKKRWGIECLFADAKTRGLNLEDTRLTHPAKLDTLLALLTLAFIWIYRSATETMGYKAIKRKVHGRREKSWFRTGLDALRQAILYNPVKASEIWTKLCPKRKIRV